MTAPTFGDLVASEKPLYLPGAHDALSARLIERAGFKAYMIGGFPLVGARYAIPDVGLVGLGEMSAAMRDIIDACDLPVFVDGDNGYGDVKTVVKTVETYQRMGAQAIQIEDQISPKRCGHMAGKEVIPIERAVAHIKAAKESSDLWILGRTDAGQKYGLDEALRRADAYIEAGADGIFVEAPTSIPRTRTDRRRLRCPAARQHARRRAHTDPQTGRALRTRFHDRRLWHFAADAHHQSDAGRTGRYEVGRTRFVRNRCRLR